MNNRLPVTIPVQSWFKDHSFNGKTVLAAVETMILLAAESLKRYPDIDIRVMEDALFPKFLEVPQQQESLGALIEYEERSDGGLQSKLLSQVQVGKMRRIKNHGEITFQRSRQSASQIEEIEFVHTERPTQKITSEYIYQKLVPFGPQYHTLQGKLKLSDHGAWGKLRAPQHPFTNPVQKIIGSPFPFDGAMHAACVLGQQFVDYPPFPVGFRKRTIAKPTLPGAEYVVKVVPVSHSADEQVFDLGIFNVAGEVFETLRGLRMRDVRKGLR
jgi:hypothetical protein